jgi:hemerythrin-like domain-containing protein
MLRRKTEENETMPTEPLKRFVQHGLDEGEIASPMAPPEAYAIPPAARLSVSPEDFAPPLRQLFDEHTAFLAILEAFERALVVFRDSGFTMNPEISGAFREFFSFMDNQTPSHNAKEEKALFPLLRERLVGAGECSPGMNVCTPTDVMEDEHERVMQSACLVFNLLGTGAKLPDERSRAIVYQHAVDQGREIVDVMRLHIFRENEVLLPLAQKLITPAEFAAIGEKMAKL